MRKFLPIVALLLLAATGCRETEKVDMDLGMYESDAVEACHARIQELLAPSGEKIDGFMPWRWGW